MSAGAETQAWAECTRNVVRLLLWHAIGDQRVRNTMPIVFAADRGKYAQICGTGIMLEARYAFADSCCPDSGLICLVQTR
jgi:hypothetical protein